MDPYGTVPIYLGPEILTPDQYTGPVLCYEGDSILQPEHLGFSPRPGNKIEAPPGVDGELHQRLLQLNYHQQREVLAFIDARYPAQLTIPSLEQYHCDPRLLGVPSPRDSCQSSASIVSSASRSSRSIKRSTTSSINSQFSHLSDASTFTPTASARTETPFATDPAGTVFPPHRSQFDSPAPSPNSSRKPTQRSSSKASSNLYECTKGCSKRLADSLRKTFPAKYEWKRHELLHEPRVVYTCMLDITSWNQSCPLCSSPITTEEHLNKVHKAQKCINKPLDKRPKYYRSDKFLEHIENEHSPQVVGKGQGQGFDRLLQRWGRKCADNESWGCGFCAKFLASWEDRIEHISNHFVKDGFTMDDWSEERVQEGLLSGRKEKELPKLPSDGLEEDVDMEGKSENAMEIAEAGQDDDYGLDSGEFSADGRERGW